MPKNTFSRPYAEVYFVRPERLKKHFYKDKHKSIVTNTGRWHFNEVYVIFCGKKYVGLKCEHSPTYNLAKNGLAMHPQEDTQVFWDKDEFVKWSEEKFKLVPVIEDVNGWRQYDNELFTAKDVSKSEYSTLIKHRISIAIYISTTNQWGIDFAGLQDLQFYRVFPAVDAFQELDMWMSGALGMPGNPMVEVSDDVRMAKHGMDKWSFRKKVR
jgi:hypothetical protein